MKIVQDRVKPERMKSKRKVYRDKWWQYAEKRANLYETIHDMNRVLVCPTVTKYLSFCFVETGCIFLDKLCIFPFDQYSHLALLNSSFHEVWAREYSGTLGTTLQYTTSDSFETFPFTKSIRQLDSFGERYQTHRQSIMLANQEGLTQTYNRFHDPYEYSADIVKLHELHKEMDEAVAHAYGWDDLELEHGFHETKQGLRYTISEAARREVLDRLLLLNHERHEQEVAQGLHEKGTKSVKGGKKKVEARQDGGNSRKKAGKGDVAQQGPTLFDLDGVG
jgi:hypothetical protein